ncbi:hypothetical protein V1264_015781 [Littorina saxatilis]|uniref:Sialate O-acetylesterase domain-containing protein n=1 Tax=Littorina saxatilis TaxID=31220 RepID=A0AAN9BLS4_9CAEN
MASACVLIFLLAAFFHQGDCVLKLATNFGDHMVLQRAPQQAVLWGTADTEGDTITAKITGQGSQGTPTTAKVSHGKWKLELPAQTGKGPFTVDVSSSDGHVMLHDVLFGDVWLCSGQSNMYFGFSSVINATAELHHALQFPDIRFTRAKRVQSATPQDTMAFDIPWTGPNSRYIGSSSAVCWLFAEYLHEKLKYPIGLVESSWGGTPVEAWSPPQVFTACAHHNKRAPNGHGVLYNAMIHPLLSTTLYGALWYQGESNSGRAEQYGCQISNMVKQWRTQFHQQSLHQTSNSFPFGYVQLAGNANTSLVGAFPGERWAQTANYGYNPNPAMPKTFMAVAMDLPDYNSPRGTIHPRYKQDVAQRLVLGALNVAYGQKDVVFQGPFPSAFMEGQHTLEIQYDHGHAKLTVRNNKGFEVCCSVSNMTHCDDRHDAWVAALLTKHQTSLVTLGTSRCGTRHVVGVRYEWRTSPCDFKQCSLYDSASGLPAPPYISHDLKPNQGPEIIG